MRLQAKLPLNTCIHQNVTYKLDASIQTNEQDMSIKLYATHLCIPRIQNYNGVCTNGFLQPANNLQPPKHVVDDQFIKDTLKIQIYCWPKGHNPRVMCFDDNKPYKSYLVQKFKNEFQVCTGMDGSSMGYQVLSQSLLNIKFQRRLLVYSSCKQFLLKISIYG